MFIEPVLFLFWHGTFSTEVSRTVRRAIRDVLFFLLLPLRPWDLAVWQSSSMYIGLLFGDFRGLEVGMAWQPWKRRKIKVFRPPISLWSGPHYHSTLQHVCGAPSRLQSFEKVSSFIFLGPEEPLSTLPGTAWLLAVLRPSLDWLHHHSPCGPRSEASAGDWPLVLHAHRLFNDEM